MKAVSIYSFGGPEALVYEDAPCPRPQAGEVQIRVHAAGVNPVDWKIREGHFSDTIHHSFPLVMGWDLSGVVETLGAGSNRFNLGDEVYSRPDISRDGAYAEYIVVKETEVALKPKSLDHVHSAAIPLAGLTAWQSLFDAAKLASGQKVLIHAAAGGVGSMAVQLAKWKGAYVIGTASSGNREYLLQLGADEVIDYQATRFEESVRNVDVVFDTIGGDTQVRSWGVLKPGGILVSIASLPSSDMAATHGVRQVFVFVQPDAVQLAQIAGLADSGKLVATVETLLPLADARRAQELSRGGHTRGKIVLNTLCSDKV